MARYAILAIGSFDYILNKTGNMLIRYQPDDVVAVIDPDKAGRTADDIIGIGGSLPVVGSFQDALQYQPDTMVIGFAPPGGVINDETRKEILIAIDEGCDIISGMHVFLNDDDEISDRAKNNDVLLTDLRRPPNPPHFPKGTWKDRNVPVLLVVGTDCDSGKMTTAWEITQRLRTRGKKVNFIGTGQTGILLGGSGVAVDAVIADFMAGELEYVIDRACDGADLVVVEGQGSINNYAYSGVTMGLIHGCMPDYFVLTHDPSRPLDVLDYPIPDINDLIQLHLDLMRPFRKTRFLGINLLTFSIDEQNANNIIIEYEKDFGLATTDLVRFGDRGLINVIDEVIS